METSRIGLMLHDSAVSSVIQTSTHVTPVELFPGRGVAHCSYSDHISALTSQMWFYNGTCIRECSLVADFFLFFTETSIQ